MWRGSGWIAASTAFASTSSTTSSTAGTSSTIPWRRIIGPPPMPGLFQRHVEDRSRPEALAFLARLRTLMDSYGARMTVGEVYDEPPLPRQKEYVAGRDRLHTAYGFFLLNAGRATQDLFAQTITAWGDADGWPSWSLGNHDVPRFASRMAGDDPARVKLLTALLLCLRGTIFLYQGEELGLPQAKVPFERLRDPFAIAAWTGEAGRDGARTPMPWMSAAPNGGFSTADETWLPVDERHLALAAEAQEADKTSMLHFTRRIIAAREKLPTLKLGSAKVIVAPGGMFAFERLYDRERLICVFDFSGDGAEFCIARLRRHCRLGHRRRTDRWRTPGLARVRRRGGAFEFRKGFSMTGLDG